MNRIEYAGLTFDNEQIITGEIYEAVSLLCDALEIGTFQVELYITDETVGRQLMSFKRNAPLEYYEAGRKKGIWYVDSVQRTGKFTYEIKANDAAALLEQSKHMGGIYTGQTAAELIADICTIPYAVKSNLSEIKLYGWLPAASRRDNLAQVLFAIGAVAKIDQTGTLRLEGLWNGTTAHISPDRVFWGDKVKYDSAVTEVSVIEHQYVPGTEETELFDGTAAENDTILFNEPMHDLTATGFTILESGANYAVLSAGSGTLTGKKYVHSTRSVRRSVSDADVANVVEVKNATLVSLVNSVGVVERLGNYYTYVQTMENNTVYAGENAGQVLSFEHPYGEEAFGTIKSVEISLGNQKAVAAQKTVIGFRPLKTENVEYYDRRDLVVESGSWIVPDNVASNIHVVLIGGGQGGEAGAVGENGSDGKPASASSGGYSKGLYGKGGAGGSGGSGGRGGNILSFDLEVSPGDVFEIEIGVGGDGSDVNGETGISGTDTVLVVGGKRFTSADGSSSPSGYTDLATGETYAASGTKGVDGGDGGDGGATETNGTLADGEQGGSADQNAGGSGGLTGSETGGSTPYSWTEYKESSSFVSYVEVGATYSGYKTKSFNTKTGEWTLSGFATVTTSTYLNQEIVYNISGSGASQRVMQQQASYDSTSGKVKITTSYWAKRSNNGVAWRKGFGGGGGGGAAQGSDGSPGQLLSNGTGTAGIGGDGADGRPQPTPTSCGTGGNGGAGGGGGGGGGGSFIETYETFEYTATASARAGGLGGLGGPGGSGAHGGVLLYFGTKHISASGAITDKSNRFILDRTGRLMVV